MALFLYTKHARVRMAERKVSEKEVQETVLQPTKWLHGRDGEIIAIRKIGSKEIRVAYFSDPKAIKIITVMKN